MVTLQSCLSGDQFQIYPSHSQTADYGLMAASQHQYPKDEVGYQLTECNITVRRNPTERIQCLLAFSMSIIDGLDGTKSLDFSCHQSTYGINTF